MLTHRPCACRPALLTLCLLGLPLTALQAADPVDTQALFRCRGADGVTSYQQKPCSEGQQDAGRILYQAVEPSPPPALPQQAPPPVPPAAPAAPIEPAAPTAPAPAVFSGTADPRESASDAVECLRPDTSTYVRSGECERSAVGGDKVEGYVIDEETGQRVWMETVTPRREIQDPARALGRLEACELSKLHIEQIRAGKAQGGVFLRDAERVRDRHCDR